MNKKYQQLNRSIRFRRFSHKAYAAFASMHRQVSIGRVSRLICDKELQKAGKAALLLGIWLSASGLQAADSTIPPDDGDARFFQLEEVSVTAITSQTASSAARQVITLSPADIQRLPATMSVNQLLSNLPGVDVRERGATGVQADISIHGCTADQTIVLLNGVNLTDPQTGHYSMNLPIRAEDIARIEVFESTPQGLGAYAGVINIVTHQVASADTTAHTEIDAALQAGEYGLFRPGVGVRHQKGQLHLEASGEYNQSTGYANNTDYRIGQAYLHGSYGAWSWQAGAQMKDAGANSFYALSYPNQFDATRMAFASGSYHGKVAEHWVIDADISYRAHYDRFELFREGSTTPAWYTNHNKHWTHQVNGDVKASFLSRVGTTSVGVTLHDAIVESNTLGSHNRLTANYFVQQTFAFKQVALSLLAGGTANTAFAADWSYAVALRYQPADWVSLYAHSSRALRLPTFTDLYYHSATQTGNANLKAEHAYKASLGAVFFRRWENLILDGRVNGYYRYGTDVIDWVRTPAETAWRSENHTNLHSWGCEAAATITFARQGMSDWQGALGGFLKQIHLSYAYSGTDRVADDYLSKYALDYLQHHASLRIDHVLYRDLGATWSLHFRQRHGTYADRDGNICSYEPVWLLDGSIYYRPRSGAMVTRHTWLRGLTLALECRNMANQRYYDYGGILQPRHQVVAKITYTFSVLPSKHHL